MERYALAGIVAMSLIIATFAFVLTSTGCESPAVRWVGRYQGEQADLVDSRLNDPIAVSLRRVILELNSDSTYTLVKASIPQSGDATFTDSKVYLHPTKLLDQAMAKQTDEVRRQNPDLTFERRADGKLMLFDPGSFGVKEVELRRVTSKN